MKELHAFSGTDGTGPGAALTFGNDGNFYGTTRGDDTSKGTVFMVSPDGGTFKTLHTFNSDDGSSPFAGLLQANDGNLYGTTESGGPNGEGGRFKLSTGGTRFKILHAFDNIHDGRLAGATLTQANDGNLYGTTALGGEIGLGTAFMITPDGTTFKTLHAFNENDGEGIFPESTLLQASDVNLYGTTANGGVNGAGTGFTLTLDGSMFATVYSLRSDIGSNPSASLV